MIDHFAPHRTKVPVVIGISHCENTDYADLDNFIEYLQVVLANYDLASPIYPVDPRDVESSIMVLQLFDALNDSYSNDDWIESDAG